MIQKLLVLALIMFAFYITCDLGVKVWRVGEIEKQTEILKKQNLALQYCIDIKNEISSRCKP